MYEIFTDTAANLDCSLLEELGVELIPFSFYYNGEEHRVTMDWSATTTWLAMYSASAPSSGVETWAALP